MKICYIPKDFQKRSRAIIVAANDIIEQYQAQGFTLTLRQLYYQFVARDLIPNSQQSYKNLGSVINDARLAGYIDWYAIEDRTRNLRGLTHWENPEEIIENSARGYQIDLWEDQPYRPEVWIEKDALVGVIERVCENNDVDYFACRGYNSQSEQWSAGQRILRRQRLGQTVVIIHLGDHDPSGINMSEDNLSRLSMFAEQRIELRRIALNMDQVTQYNPPPNPAKITDSRYERYIQEYGPECWELDALEPAVIENLIQAEIDSVRDQELWDASNERQEEEREQLQRIADNWTEINQWLDENL